MFRLKVVVVALAVATPLTLPVNPAGANHYGAWYAGHCADYNSDPNTGAHMFYPILLVEEGSGVSSSNWRDIVEDKSYRADSFLEKSHGTIKQHYRFACDRDSTGKFYRMHGDVYTVPMSQDDGSAGGVAGNGNIGCKEAWDWAWNVRTDFRSHKHRRYLFLFDTSIAVEYPSPTQAESCTFATNGVGFSTTAGKQPGRSNLMNETAAYATFYSAVWKSTDLMKAAGTFHHEILHSLGGVHYEATGSCSNITSDDGTSSGCGAHTNDEPDALRYSPYDANDPDGRAKCTTAANNAIPENPGAYVDCGRDSYWAPAAGTANPWLCKQYNIATDSLYIINVQPRKAGCEA